MFVFTVQDCGSKHHHGNRIDRKYIRVCPCRATKRKKTGLTCLFVHPQGFEPWTPWLRVRCSTNWATGAFTSALKALSLICGCKSTTIFLNHQTFSHIFSILFQVIYFSGHFELVIGTLWTGYRDTLNRSSGHFEQVVRTGWTGHRDRVSGSSGQSVRAIGTECPAPSGQSVRPPFGQANSV